MKIVSDWGGKAGQKTDAIQGFSYESATERSIDPLVNQQTDLPSRTDNRWTS